MLWHLPWKDSSRVLWTNICGGLGSGKWNLAWIINSTDIYNQIKYKNLEYWCQAFIFSWLLLRGRLTFTSCKLKVNCLYHLKSTVTVFTEQLNNLIQIAKKFYHHQSLVN